MPSVLALLAAAVLFGTTGAAQALGPDATTPVSVGAMRLVGGGVGLAVFGYALARRRRIRSHEPARRPGQSDLALMAATAWVVATARGAAMALWLGVRVRRDARPLAVEG